MDDRDIGTESETQRQRERERQRNGQKEMNREIEKYGQRLYGRQKW